MKMSELVCHRLSSWGRRGVLIAALVAVVVVVGGARLADGGGSSYTPTKGEWMCLMLNMAVTMEYSREIPAEINIAYNYDPADPDTITIDLVYNLNVRPGEVEAQAKQAEKWATDFAKARGWDSWLKLKAKAEPVEDRL